MRKSEQQANFRITCLHVFFVVFFTLSEVFNLMFLNGEGVRHYFISVLKSTNPINGQNQQYHYVPTPSTLVPGENVEAILRYKDSK